MIDNKVFSALNSISNNLYLLLSWLPWSNVGRKENESVEEQSLPAPLSFSRFQQIQQQQNQNQQQPSPFLLLKEIAITRD